jgi:hypothetical protein
VAFGTVHIRLRIGISSLRVSLYQPLASELRTNSARLISTVHSESVLQSMKETASSLVRGHSDIRA